MAVRNPPGWMAGTYPAAALRAFMSQPWQQDPASATIKPLSGIIPRGGSLDCPISVSGSTVTVGVFAAKIAGTENTQQYAYDVINETPTAITVPVAPASQTRLDRIVARVRDSAYSGSSVDADVVLVQGVPASTNPSLPAEPANSHTIATVQRTASGALTVLFAWRYITPVGGVTPSRSGVVDNGVAPAYAGQYRDLAGALQRGSAPGGVWQTVANVSEWVQFTPTLYYAGTDNQGNIAPGTYYLGDGSSAIARYLVQGKSMHLRYIFRGTVPGHNAGRGAIYTVLPPGFLSASQEETQIICKLNTLDGWGIFMGKCFIPPNSNRMRPYLPVSPSNCRLHDFIVSRAGGLDNGNPVTDASSTHRAPNVGILVIQGTIEIQ